MKLISKDRTFNLDNLHINRKFQVFFKGSGVTFQRKSIEIGWGWLQLWECLNLTVEKIMYTTVQCLIWACSVVNWDFLSLRNQFMVT